VSNDVFIYPTLRVWAGSEVEGPCEISDQETLEACLERSRAGWP